MGVVCALAAVVALTGCKPERPQKSTHKAERSAPTGRYKVVKSDEEWRAQLTPEQYDVTRRKGTERAFTGKYHDHKEKGVYKCVCCDEPLFASYLFLHGAMEATYLAVATKRVANVVKVSDQQRFIRELDQIRRALVHGAELSPYPYLKVGRRARVTAGPFRDIEGMIEEFPKPDRLILQIEALGRATSLEVDAGLLEPVDWS